MSRLKTSSLKSAKTSSSTGYEKTKRRKKKGSLRRSASSIGASSSPSSPPLAPSSPLSITAPTGMRNSVSSSTGSPSASTPTSSRECEQCGNPAQLEIGANAKAIANCKKVANSGCHVCDFVAYRKALRHCVVCDKTQCDVFCDWCGHGFHTKCAKIRGEHVDANGFCCKKCEAEQATDDSDNDDDTNDINAKCGECQRPFTSTTTEIPASNKKDKAKEAADATGFKVNQSVLVENDEVLYNAVITDVDAKNERIKIHFLRWSKSFDNWYAMDDERINESLACDCCNRWFHIGCLPPIKSSGRFKDTTYVCPSCLDEARGFYGGTRTTMTSTKSSKSTTANGATMTTSRRKTIEKEEPTIKKRSSKLVVQSDSEEEEEEEEEEDEEPIKTKSSRRTSEKENIKEENTTKSKKRRRANSVDSDGSNSSDKRTKATLSPVTKSEHEPTKKSGKAKRRERSTSHEEDEETKDHKEDESKATNRNDEEEETKASEKAPDEDVTMSEAITETTEKVSSSSESKSKESEASKPSEETATSNESLSMDKPAIKRKVSGHSMSSLLNSPSSPPPRSDSPVKAPASSSSVRVKVEKDPLALPAGSASKKHDKPTTRSKVWVTGRDAKTAKAAAAAAAASASSSSSSTSTTTNRNSLSAFDILREVAAQSMSDDIDTPAGATAHPPTDGTSRRPHKTRMTAAERKAMVKNESDKAARTANSNTTTTNGRTPSSSHPPAPIGVGIPMNSYVDLHFAIRKEMYLRICMLEDERLLERETAQLLRSMIYPTSDKFHDLKFVYVVNKDLSSLQLTKRLLELVPVTSGGTAPVIPMRPALGAMGHLPHPPPAASFISSANSSAAPSPARPPNTTVNASPARTGYSTPARTSSPALDKGTSHQPDREPEPNHNHKLFQLPTSIGYAAAIDRRTLGSSMTTASSTTSGSSSILTSVISPSSVVGPPMPPPPLSTKLLLETMHKHSKFPTLLPPHGTHGSNNSHSSSTSASVTSTTSSASTVPTTSSISAVLSASAPTIASISAVLSATTTSTTVASSSSATTVSSSTTTTTVVPVAVASTSLTPSKPSPERASPPLVNNPISASISSN